MWDEFKEWYETQHEPFSTEGIIPNYIINWGDNSWLKYFIKFVVEKNKFFVYPYNSLSSNLSSVGEHNQESTTAYQVPMQVGIRRNYNLPSIESIIKYDVFFERIFDNDAIKYSNISLDLYGTRDNYGDARYIASVKSLPYKVVEEIALSYRPIEVNIQKPIPGRGIYIYDTYECDKRKKNRTDTYIGMYEVKALSTRILIKYIVISLKKTILTKIRTLSNKTIKAKNNFRLN